MWESSLLSITWSRIYKEHIYIQGVDQQGGRVHHNIAFYIGNYFDKYHHTILITWEYVYKVMFYSRASTSDNCIQQLGCNIQWIDVYIYSLVALFMCSTEISNNVYFWFCCYGYGLDSIMKIRHHPPSPYSIPAVFFLGLFFSWQCTIGQYLYTITIYAKRKQRKYLWLRYFHLEYIYISCKLQIVRNTW